MRYKGIKGKFWDIFSQYIRLRDWYKYGTCVSCYKHIEHWKEADAGHYIAASKGGFALLFNEDNVHLQCKHCNNPTWSPDSSVGYGFELERRLGVGTTKRLYDMKKLVTKEWSKLEYAQKIAEYKAKIEALRVIHS